MFDNPKQSLERLEQELLAAEAPRKKKGSKKKQEDPDKALEEVKQLLAEDDWKSTHRAPLSKSYDPDYEEALWSAEAPREFPKTQSRGGVRPGLIVAMVLETLGLVAVLLWWLL